MPVSVTVKTMDLPTSAKRTQTSPSNVCLNAFDRRLKTICYRYAHHRFLDMNGHDELSHAVEFLDRSGLQEGMLLSCANDGPTRHGAQTQRTRAPHMRSADGAQNIHPLDSTTFARTVAATHETWLTLGREETELASRTPELATRTLRTQRSLSGNAITSRRRPRDVSSSGS